MNSNVDYQVACINLFFNLHIAARSKQFQR